MPCAEAGVPSERTCSDPNLTISPLTISPSHQHKSPRRPEPRGFGERGSWAHMPGSGYSGGSLAPAPSTASRLQRTAPASDPTGLGYTGSRLRPGPRCGPRLAPSRRLAMAPLVEPGVESRMGAVAWGQWPAPRFPSPLIEPDVPVSGIRLSDWLHRKAHGVTDQGRRSRRSRPSSP